LATLRIANKLGISLGEIYYEEFCDQEGWTYVIGDFKISIL
jgi:hypothetical protein